jgi:3',5'-cyclic AMP phosphodiesterase CpdA
MIHIVHLSDIHFGKPFDCGTWDGVVQAVVDIEPDLIIASGDLCHQPSPAHLLAAKCALHELSESVRKRSLSKGRTHAGELFFIPGNHDVFDFGVGATAPRLNWYERIFNADTEAAKQALSDRVGCPPAFNEQYRKYERFLAGRIKSPLKSIKDWWAGRSDFVASLVASPPRWEQVRIPANSPVLLALFDSNSAGGGFEIATGVVDNSQLTKLRSALRDADKPYLARIAIVHHHVLPIAFTPDTITGEPMMVLRNAGAVLSVLTDYRFDLILHGHWHKAQFARFELGTEDGDSYPISVAAAGSAAWDTKDPKGNCFNVIKITDNGRIEVKQVFYGGGQPPDPHGTTGRPQPIFREPMMAVKRRAFARALERHFIDCDTREQKYEITENGDLKAANVAKALRVHGNDAPTSYTQRPLLASIPLHSRFIENTNILDETLPYEGNMVIATGHTVAGTNHFWINLPDGGLTRGGRPVDYCVGFACSNNMKMSQWEAREKANHAHARPEGWDHEFVGVRVTYPMRKLRFNLKFPESLAECQVKVRCMRHSHYPNYKIDKYGDAILTPPKPAENGAETKLDDQDKFEMVDDADLRAEEESRLQYDAPHRTWKLDVDRPMVGCTYTLHWKLPGHTSDPTIEGQTIQSRIKLLGLRDRVADEHSTLSAQDKEAVEEFDELRRTLELELSDGDPGERRTTALFVYNPKSLSLHPALIHRSWTSQPSRSNFSIPLGSGIAGAAFLQRRIIPWGRQWTNDPLIEPVMLPDSDPASETENQMVNIVALPVYHRALRDERRPPPWATIGVVCMSSSSYGSRITELADDGPKAEKKLLSLRTSAQIQAELILAALANNRTPSAAPSTTARS